MIKFLDLHKINERFRGEIDSRIKSVLDSGWYLQGKENDKFSKNFAAYCGVKHALGVANGLDALNLIICGYGWGVGDEIIVKCIGVNEKGQIDLSRKDALKDAQKRFAKKEEE